MQGFEGVADAAPEADDWDPPADREFAELTKADREPSRGFVGPNEDGAALARIAVSHRRVGGRILRLLQDP